MAGIEVDGGFDAFSLSPRKHTKGSGQESRTAFPGRPERGAIAVVTQRIASENCDWDKETSSIVTSGGTGWKARPTDHSPLPPLHYDSRIQIAFRYSVSGQLEATG